VYGSWKPKEYLLSMRQVDRLKYLLDHELHYGIHELLDDCIIEEMIVLLKEFEDWSNSPYSAIYPHLQLKYAQIARYVGSSDFEEL